MALVDLEVILRNIGSIIPAKLNDEIAIVIADKAPTFPLTLPEVEVDQWHLQQLPESLNVTPFVVYGFQDLTQSDESNFDDIQVAKIFIEVVIGDANDQDNYFRLLRYTRALRQAIQKNSQVFEGGVKPTVKALLPALVRVEKQALEVGGIEIEITLG